MDGKGLSRSYSAVASVACRTLRTVSVYVIVFDPSRDRLHVTLTVIRSKYVGIQDALLVATDVDRSDYYVYMLLGALRNHRYNCQYGCNMGTAEVQT